MSEYAPQSKEHLKGLEELERDAERRLPDAEHAEALRPGEKDPRQALTEARREVLEAKQEERLPNPIEKLQEAEKTSQPPTALHINRDLKKITFHRELFQIQRHLSTPQRALSKVIHQPVISKVSEASSKTISRPSGMLGGGLVALLGSTGYLWLAHNQGFRYNYMVFLALFFGGFVIGLVLEFLVWTVTRNRRHAIDQ